MNIFNVRVYGVMITEHYEILLCREKYQGMEFIKFPGGGLEFGEGLLDALRREFLEETGMLIEIDQHFYTTDFFQRSVFNADHQLISVYYLVKPQPFLVPPKEEGNPEFFWKKIDDLSVDDVTFPIDKFVLKKLLTFYAKDSGR